MSHLALTYPKRAIVTGGANGIGRAICELFAQGGYRVAIADIDGTEAKALASRLGAGHIDIEVDLTKPNAASNLLHDAMSKLGGLDCVINNAGMTDTSGRTLIDLPEEAIERLVTLNFEVVQELSIVSASLLPKGGSIVNIASGAAYRPLALRGPYSATKAGVVAMTAAMAPDLAKRGIFISAVAPGYTKTALVDELVRQGRVDLDLVATNIPLGRVALPEDIAKTVAFLAGPEGDALAGQTLVVDGGGFMGPAIKGTAPFLGNEKSGTLVLLNLDPKVCLIEGTEGVSVDDINGSVAACVQYIETKNTARALSQMMATARRIATYTKRTKDFALLFVFPKSNAVSAAAGGMLARTLALEWAAAGMRVNTITWDGTIGPKLGHICRFLTGSEASFITGQNITGTAPP